MEWFKSTFAATIALGMLAMAGLLYAGIAAGSVLSVRCALIAMGAAYAGQSIQTYFAAEDSSKAPSGLEIFAVFASTSLQIVACAAFVIGAIYLFGG